MTQRQRFWLFSALGCLAAFMILTVLASALGFWKERTGDLSAYVTAGTNLWSGEEIYRPLEPRPFTYPPFLAVPFAFFSRLPGIVHRPLWYCLNAFVLIGSFGLINRFAPKWITGRAWVFWTLLFALTLRYVGSVFENQSNDLFILFLAAWAATFFESRREAAGGAMVGLGAAIKATPLLFLPVLLWQRRYVGAAALAAALAVATLLPDLFRPREDGRLWVHAWYSTFVADVSPGEPAPKVGEAWSRTNILNQNLAGTLYRLSTPIEGDGDMEIDASVWNPDRGLLRGITLAAQALVLAVVLWGTRPVRAGIEPRELGYRRFGEVGVVGCGMVLLSPMSSKSHFVILCLPVAFCLLDYLYRGRDRVLGALLLGVLATGPLTTKGIWGRELGNQIQARGAITASALLALAATAYALIRHRKRFVGRAR